MHPNSTTAPAWLTAGETEDEVHGRLKTGKEAEVFVVERRTLDGSRHALLAHKRYRPTSVRKGELEAGGFTRAHGFVHDRQYREGRRFRNGRNRRAAEPRDRPRPDAAGRPVARAGLASLTTFEAGVTVPFPVERTDDGLLMQLLGDARTVARAWSTPGWTRASSWPRSTSCRKTSAGSTRAGLVHADLSPYNALWWDERLWLIDFPQSVDLVHNPHGFDLLHHDVTTMCTWFTRRGLPVDAEHLFAELLAEASSRPRPLMEQPGLPCGDA